MWNGSYFSIGWKNIAFHSKKIFFILSGNKVTEFLYYYNYLFPPFFSFPSSCLLFHQFCIDTAQFWSLNSSYFISWDKLFNVILYSQSHTQNHTCMNGIINSHICIHRQSYNTKYQSFQNSSLSNILLLLSLAFVCLLWNLFWRSYVVTLLLMIYIYIRVLLYTILSLVTTSH